MPLYLFKSQTPNTMKKLETCLDNTSASYKYLWLLEIIDRIAYEDEVVIDMNAMATSMLERSWTMMVEHDLSFGNVDSIRKIYARLGLFEMSQEEAKQYLRYSYKISPELRSAVSTLLNNVPYRFLSPWIPWESNAQVRADSQRYHNNSPYSIEDKKIVINPKWIPYFKHNHKRIREFVNDGFNRFLSSRNPYVDINTLGRAVAESDYKYIRCPFCNLSTDIEVLYEDDLVLGFYDLYPVSEGHSLIIPKEHISDYFDINISLQTSMWTAVNKVQPILSQKHSPQGFNIGVNIGHYAGQSIYHSHIHLIPRYAGDVAFPKGGVRGVIPDKQSY